MSGILREENYFSDTAFEIIYDPVMGFGCLIRRSECFVASEELARVYRAFARSVNGLGDAPKHVEQVTDLGV